MIFEFKKNIKNIFGYKSSSKFIIFESDDWGSNRMPSVEVFNHLKSLRLVNDLNRYDRYDTIASAADLSSLFEVLHSVRDSLGNPAKFTPVSVLANPDFAKIHSERFSVYHYELFTDYLKRRGDETAVMSLWHEGIDNGFFVPQFHGREHLNVTSWMNALKANHYPSRSAFESGVYGITFNSKQVASDNFLAAFDFFDLQELTLQEEIIRDGLNQFENLFGFRSCYFVPPNGPLSSRLNKVLFENGVLGIQTARVLYHEPVGYNRRRPRFRYFGMKSSWGQFYFLRNAFFEPNEPSNFSWVENCLKDVENAFRWQKPAVISTHRVNYIGVLDQSNRDNSLVQLKELLRRLVNKWPDIVFVTSDELVKMM